MNNNKSLNVLVSSFACGPYWGSEVGMGWDWITYLSEDCKLFVITEKGFEKDIENEISLLNLKFPPQFYYIDIGSKARKLFWKQGSPMFYFYYERWQKKAFSLSKKILGSEHIDIIHQLNLIGFREPGYLWKHGKKYPFIWGPIGGINQIPFNYILHFKLKNLLFYLSKNLIQHIQLFFSPRVIKALRAAKFVVSESTNTQNVLKDKFKTQSILIHETGCNLSAFKYAKKNNSLIELIWVGKIQGTKALPIALKAFSKVKERDNFHLTIIGDGPDERFCKRLAKNLGIDDVCTFLGKIPNKEVLSRMENSDLLFFTSLKEGTATVVLEALSLGVPVLCHDKCGFGDIVNKNCGIKIPMISYTQSINLFTEALSRVAIDRSILPKLAEGALKERVHISVKSNSKKMYDLYLNALNTHSILKCKIKEI